MTDDDPGVADRRGGEIHAIFGVDHSMRGCRQLIGQLVAKAKLLLERQPVAGAMVAVAGWD
ncbi:MAG: hypothetical protein ACRDYX_00910 [Egibacteraceae bacterium]